MGGFRKADGSNDKPAPTGKPRYLDHSCMHAQSCPTLCNPVDCSPPGSSLHGILQQRLLEWVAISYSRGSSPPKDQTQSRASSALARGFLTTGATWEAPGLDHDLCIKRGGGCVTDPEQTVAHPQSFTCYILGSSTVGNRFRGKINESLPKSFYIILDLQSCQKSL